MLRLLLDPIRSYGIWIAVQLDVVPQAKLSMSFSFQYVIRIAFLSLLVYVLEPEAGFHNGYNAGRYVRDTRFSRVHCSGTSFNSKLANLDSFP
jgi:hypothetical protein